MARQQSFLDAVRERVVIFDGGMGSNLQLRDLSADDFGGPTLEGCNEMLVFSRPDVVAICTRRSSPLASMFVETQHVRGFLDRVAGIRRGDRAHEINVAAARIARAGG